MISRLSISLGGLCVLALAMAGCAGTPPEEDPVQIKLKDLDTRLGRIDRVVANQSLLDLANQNDAMRADLRAMHNDIDQLNNKLETSRKEQHDLYADLDRRMKALEGRGGGGSAAGPGEAGAAGAGAAGAGAAGSSAGSGADDKVAYQAAFDLLKNSQIDAAIAAFQKFLLSFPDSTLADNAQYWLGEANYVNKAFPAAQAAFQKLVDKFPQSRKVPDALLKIGYCQYELKDFDAARRTLSKVTTQFPDSPSGHLAQQRLDSMAAEKH